MKFSCGLVLYLEKFSTDVEVSVLFLDDHKMKRLNLKYRKKDEATDVLSFPTRNFYDDYYVFDGVVILGDIVISTQRAMEQAFDFGCYFEEEMARLVVHAMLHLIGYDHEKNDFEKEIMERKEKILNNIILKKYRFGRVDDYE